MLRVRRDGSVLPGGGAAAARAGPVLPVLPAPAGHPRSRLLVRPGNTSQHSVNCLFRTILVSLKVPQVVMGYFKVCCWDLRVGGRPQAVSPFPVSHRGPTCSIIWVASKTGAEFFTASLDGTVGMHSEKYLHMCFYVYPSSTYNDSRFDDPCGKCLIVR